MKMADKYDLWSFLEMRTVKELPPGKMSHVQSSPLWKPILRHGLCETMEISQTKTPSNQVESNMLDPFKETSTVQVGGVLKLCCFPLCQTNTWTLEDLTHFLEDFARWDPSQEPTDRRTELMRTIMQSCKKHPMRHEIAVGSKTDQAVNAIWAAMMYHTPALNSSLKAYGKVQ